MVKHISICELFYPSISEQVISWNSQNWQPNPKPRGINGNIHNNCSGL